MHKYNSAVSNNLRFYVSTNCIETTETSRYFVRVTFSLKANNKRARERVFLSREVPRSIDEKYFCFFWTRDIFLARQRTCSVK